MTFNLHPVITLTDEQFEKLAAANRGLRLEKTAKGKLIIMPPTAILLGFWGKEKGKREKVKRGRLDLSTFSSFALVEVCNL